MQKEKRGFGHAVYQCRSFAEDKPVLLVLGDTIYHTENEKKCTTQLLEAFEKTNKTTVSIHQIPAEKVIHYGVVSGTWDNQNPDTRVMKVQRFVEKPSLNYENELLKMHGEMNNSMFYSVFGEYVLTPEVFDVLERNIANNRTLNGEIQITDALDEVRQKSALYGFAVDGTMFDVGIPQAHIKTIVEFSKK